MSPIFIVLLLAVVASATQKRCGYNAEWSNCTSLCPPSCENINNPDPIVCPAVCVKGCKCKDGYILYERYNICLKPKHCDIIID